MSRPRSRRAAPDGPRRPRSASSTWTASLPVELVVETLEYLDLYDLRRAALVSRVFYAASWRAGLYLHRTLHMDEIKNRDRELKAVNDLIRQALRKNLRLSLTVSSWATPTDDEDGNTSDWLDIIEPSVLAVLSALTAAFPVLVHLSVCIPDHFVSQLFDTLRYPTPLLRSIGIGTDCNERLSEHHIPADIFACDAPKLRLVGLRNIRLASQSAAAFSRIHDARFEYTEVFPDIDFARHFPRLRDLHLGFTSTRSHAPVLFKLAHVALRKLSLDDYESFALTPAIERSIKRWDIPIVEHICTDIPWDGCVSASLYSGSYRVRLRKGQVPHTSCSVYVVAWNQGWRRTYHLRQREVRIRHIPGVEGRLEYLRMDNIYLVVLLDFLSSGKLALLAMRRLQLDFDPAWPQAAMVWPPDWADALVGDGTTTAPFCAPEDRSAPAFAPDDTFYCVRCPALATLVLFALRAGVAVAAREVAFLGRALDQCDRPKKDRAALKLIGVEFQTPAARALLGRAFSSVSHYALVEEDTDRIWEEDA